jgi:hypothetical protein
MASHTRILHDDLEQSKYLLKTAWAPLILGMIWKLRVQQYRPPKEYKHCYGQAMGEREDDNEDDEDAPVQSSSSSAAAANEETAIDFSFAFAKKGTNTDHDGNDHDDSDHDSH